MKREAVEFDLHIVKDMEDRQRQRLHTERERSSNPRQKIESGIDS